MAATLLHSSGAIRSEQSNSVDMAGTILHCGYPSVSIELNLRQQIHLVAVRTRFFDIPGLHTLWFGIQQCCQLDYTVFGHRRNPGAYFSNLKPGFSFVFSCDLAIYWDNKLTRHVIPTIANIHSGDIALDFYRDLSDSDKHRGHAVIFDSRDALYIRRDLVQRFDFFSGNHFSICNFHFVVNCPAKRRNCDLFTRGNLIHLASSHRSRLNRTLHTHCKRIGDLINSRSNNNPSARTACPDRRW
ncbi:hypothetical protein E8E13_011357 [Curvularia kusanoi]|uniref:Uncharacterized protein n=1 Tax=Curvularia kusanoi TaxID=90978 RepID=A0A9P4TMX3_CURKU|nr:hypothetical protein E8E13_011357 [Curvularia kusanoi]